MTHIAVWKVAKNRCSGGPYEATTQIDDSHSSTKAPARRSAEMSSRYRVTPSARMLSIKNHQLQTRMLGEGK